MHLLNKAFELIKTHLLYFEMSDNYYTTLTIRMLNCNKHNNHQSKTYTCVQLIISNFYRDYNATIRKPNFLLLFYENILYYPGA